MCIRTVSSQHVVLTEEQREILRRIFDTNESFGEITAPLSSYLALLVLAGPRALAGRITGIELDADVFTTWAATGPDLKSVEVRWRAYRLSGITDALSCGCMIDLSDSQLQTLMSAERRVGAMLRMRGRFNDTDVADVAKLALAGLVQQAADSVPGT